MEQGDDRLAEALRESVGPIVDLIAHRVVELLDKKRG